MPTSRPRHTVTETPSIARALDAAARTWPELRSDRASLLRRLVEVGGASLSSREEGTLTERRAAIARVAGMATGLYPPGTADRLRSEWPE
jgi:non-ribosomal peptide synthetase component E (peptide arylation enzyme)